MTQQRLDLNNWQVGQQLGAGQTWMVPITGETVGRMSTAELEAALVVRPLSGQSDKPLMVYAKCTPSRGGCSGFGG
jgi:hypothetical protein